MLIVDTNIWVDAADADRPQHAACVALLSGRRDLIVPSTVVAEAAWFIESRLGVDAEIGFLRLVTQSSRVTLVELVDADWVRVIELVGTYRSQGLGTVDASIIAVAERLGIVDIATFNGRDFWAVRPRHCDAFTLLPEGVERPVGKT